MTMPNPQPTQMEQRMGRERHMALHESRGEFVTGDDGYVVFWPEGRNGAFNSHNLRDIADELDKRNATWDAQIQSDPRITRPTADLGDDGKLVERWARQSLADARGGKLDLRDLGQAMNGKWDQDFPAAVLMNIAEAADRLILYREAREVLANRIAAAIQQARDEIGATEQQRLAFAYAEAAMRAALTHVENEEK